MKRDPTIRNYRHDSVNNVSIETEQEIAPAFHRRGRSVSSSDKSDRADEERRRDSASGRKRRPGDNSMARSDPIRNTVPGGVHVHVSVRGGVVCVAVLPYQAGTQKAMTGNKAGKFAPKSEMSWAIVWRLNTLRM